jgi:hypothetical protein
MTRLVWNKPTEHRYEYGVDRGVFYKEVSQGEYGDGRVWNGLISVEETHLGGEIASYFFDGAKYLDTVNPKTYQATFTAFSVPEQLLRAYGEVPVVPGVILTRQAKSLFGLSYRTFTKNEAGYKIHLIYNAYVTKTQSSHNSSTDSPSTETTSWKIDASPILLQKVRPTAHYILDSTKLDPDILDVIETILYGSSDELARLPNITKLVNIINNWSPLIIIPQEITGIADLVAGMGDLYRTLQNGLHGALPETRLVETALPGLYRLE